MERADICVNFGDFNATTIRVEPVSDKGRQWFDAHVGEGAASADFRKSQGESLDRQFAECGLKVNVRV